MLRFEFVEVERDIATSLSRDLRRMLLERGAQPEALSLVRGDANDMDIGSILEIASSVSILTAMEKGLSIATIVHCLYELIHRESVTVLVKGPYKTVRLRPSISHEDVQKAIEEVAPSDDRSKS